MSLYAKRGSLSFRPAIQLHLPMIVSKCFNKRLRQNARKNAVNVITQNPFALIERYCAELCQASKSLT